MLIHGAGWTSGDRRGNAGLARQFAAAGIASLAIDYRLIVAGDPASYWPAPLDDARRALRWLRAEARGRGLDPGRICASGSSAGGQLALFLGAAGHGPSALRYVIDKSGPVTWGPRMVQPARHRQSRSAWSVPARHPH